MPPPANPDPMLLLSAFDCCLCKATLAEPHTLSCGHLLCYGCITIRPLNPFTCPSCTSVISVTPAPADQFKGVLARWVQMLPEGTINALITTRLEAARQIVEHDMRNGSGLDSHWPHEQTRTRLP